MLIRGVAKIIKGFFAPTLRFKCVEGRFDVAQPVEAARSVFPAWLGKQAKERRVKFARCPGMHDYAQFGYIISAWCDIHICANKQGVSIILSKVTSEGMKGSEMNFELIDGLAPIDEGVAKRVIKIPSPWALFTKPGYSAMVMPALMHSPFLDKLYVYPGIVDYDQFHTVNFIFSAIKECDFTIPAGTPLLQVIPFKREAMTAVSGRATDFERALQGFKFASRVMGYYRRKFHSKKSFTIAIEDQQ